MGLFSRKKKPKIKIQTTKQDGFSGWLKCTHCQELIHSHELEKNNNCCPRCDYHYRISARIRIANLADEGSFTEMHEDLQPIDPLNFVDSQSYTDRLKRARTQSKNSEGVITGTCALDGHSIALGVMDFSFMAGSMGSVVGERLTRLIEHSIDNEIPVVLVTASGGARMQESVLSLMQMAKVSAALGKLHEAKVPYISVMTNPTTGGVTASFASLGDIIIAEPQALICFAGPRVIEQTIGQKLPPGAQKAEFLLKHGMVDCIVKRHELKEKLSMLLTMLTDAEIEEHTIADIEILESDKILTKKTENI
ncbi:MAG: acetyl-CoA carboxylase carboxyltransferase subunit beta [Waddliaceae bacterium]|jgi:acetyl-CoA carboxylase carboxyl transferase subunit beta|nr:acetyl-CoA carboxylase carboxyltransferase subunit beta [Waddliaceae bacterium]MBT3579424.1 acetyl-CoA carboxylase carboxyltransferase subunit beta [Waddliaceae bacterium]MBT4445177.1 acetyl-CoA carboxylase carboxyltransferase subunit beta [Waddliaceae bacterium]MBT6928158.1 acetyl-CoA carboxylase carboxyltransferase subunit beta [Waddliaceae bacterium]MBT7264491.1 acetyl-CoA carboxylase carboxyltransferase subunit beta [Waddliaceae bacterium]